MADDLSWTTVIAFNSRFSTTATTMRTTILAYVNRIAPCDWDDETITMARIYLAMHYAQSTADGSSGAAGTVISKSAGGIAKSYAAPSASSDPSLGNTAYGRMYLTIINASPSRAPFVV